MQHRRHYHGVHVLFPTWQLLLLSQVPAARELQQLVRDQSRVDAVRDHRVASFPYLTLVAGCREVHRGADGGTLEARVPTDAYAIQHLAFATLKANVRSRAESGPCRLQMVYRKTNQTAA